MERNPYFNQVRARYLFQEVRARKDEFLVRNPGTKLISLGIGDTTEPIGPHITSALTKGAALLGKRESYVGYGPEQGIESLRVAISKKLYQSKIDASDIFISDGAKCDIGRLQILFGPKMHVALQDPAYPAYLDTSIIHHGNEKITFLPCNPENNFVFDPALSKDANIIFLCSPNNPTGKVLTYEELEAIVAYAKAQKQIIIFDAAYAFYLPRGKFPRSIYEIKGANEVAIEVCSFSKIAGFSGVRLGWTVVPKELLYSTGEKVRDDWMRTITTFYNGASYIAQQGGLACVSDAGLLEIEEQVAFYLNNAKELRKVCLELGFETYGGEYSPYLWVRLKGKSSWEAFDELLEKAHLVTTPGSGFGSQGEGFLRISGFGSKETIQEALLRLQQLHECSFSKL